MQFLPILIGLSVAIAPADPQAREIDDTARFINEYLLNQWQQHKLKPAERCGDLEFLRRATLDIVGRVPTLEEARAFDKDSRADKRIRLVDRLLSSDDYARHWADVWTVLLLTRNSHPVYQEEMRGWLEKELASGTSSKALAEKLLTATGNTKQNPAVHFIANGLGRRIAAEQRAADGAFEAVPITARSMDVFFGYNFHCIRCHDHPFDPQFKQKHFWGVNAFFRQVDRVRIVNEGDSFSADLADDSRLNDGNMVFFGKRVGRLSTRAAFFDGKKYDLRIDKTRRQQLAEFVTANEQFARSQALRLWVQCFGDHLSGVLRYDIYLRDELGVSRESHHPDLLDKLGRAFAKGGHDPRKFLRSLCTSDAYQFKSSPGANVPLEPVPYFQRLPFFDRMPLKPLSPEQLLDSLLAAADRLERKGQAYAKLRRQWREAMLRFDYDASWEDLCIDMSGLLEPPLPTLATLVNAPELQELLLDPTKGTLARALKRPSHAEIADELYLAALTRHPTKKEMDAIEQEIDRLRRSGHKDLTPLWQDLFWALLNSSEFFLNH